MRQHVLAKLGEPVAVGMALDKRPADHTLEFGKPALHG
jgi:hypothetical protein